MAYDLKNFKYPSVSNQGNAQDSRCSEIAQFVMQEIEKMKLSRDYKELEWQEANKAYQTVIDTYKRAFDSTQAPEIQFRDFFKTKDMTDIKLPVEFSVIQRKLTYILSNKPKPKWVADRGTLSDDESQSNGRIFGYAFDYAWYKCDGDWEEFKAIISSLIYSIGYLHWYYDYCVYDVEVPDTMVNGVMVYKVIKRIVSRPVVEHIDNRHAYLDYNASDLSQIKKGGFVKHYDEATFKRMFKNMQIDGISAIQPNECFMKVGEEKSNQQKSVFECFYYFDEVMDRFAIVSNGYHINPYTQNRISEDNKGWSPIPSRDKTLPISYFIDHYLDSELYGMGDARLLKPFRELKNKTRNMVFDVMKKVAFHTMVIDPLSDFNEEEYEFGQPFIRAELDSIKPLPVSADLGFSVQMDENINNDIAIFTGINVQDTGNPTQNETATKTASRRESQMGMIETYIKQNMPYGWKRTWTGFKESLRLAGKIPRIDDDGKPKPYKIRTDGMKLIRSKKNDSIVFDQKQDGSYFFEMIPKDFDLDMELVPEMGNLAYTSELEDEKKREGLAILEGPSYTPDVIDKQKCAELRVELHNLPKNLVKNSTASAPGDINLKDKPENIAKNLDLLAKPPQYDEMASKLNSEVLTPGASTPSATTPDSGAVAGIQPTPNGNPAVVK